MSGQAIGLETTRNRLPQTKACLQLESSFLWVSGSGGGWHFHPTGRFFPFLEQD